MCLLFPTLHFYSLVFPVFLLSFSVSFCLSDLSVGILPFFTLVPRLLKAAKTHPHPTQRSTYGADGWLNIKKAGLFPCEARLFRAVLDCQQERWFRALEEVSSISRSVFQAVQFHFQCQRSQQAILCFSV